MVNLIRFSRNMKIREDDFVPNIDKIWDKMGLINLEKWVENYLLN